MDFEVGSVGQFLMNERGYRQDTAWLHEQVRNADLEEANIKNISTSGHDPLRGKIKIEIDKPEDPDFGSSDEAKEWVDERVRLIFEELLPEARITSTRPKYFAGNRTSGYVLFCIE